jgi:gluconokinase
MKDFVSQTGLQGNCRGLVVMGVSGSGKTDTSLAVAEALGYRHIEADHFHPAANVQRMRDGIPLSDEDRVEWLNKLITEMQRAEAEGASFVLACSALKRSYRDLLRNAMPDVRFAHLDIDRNTAMQRVSGRSGHFMPASLVDSQFATLESPEGEAGVLVVDGRRPVEQVVEQIVAWEQQHAQLAINANTDAAALAVGAEAATDEAMQAAHLTGEPIYTGAPALVFDRITDWMMAVLLGFMVIVVFVSVVMRYLFGTGWAGAEEVSQLAFVWLVFVGVASSMRRGELMSFSMIRDRFPHAFRRVIDSISWLMVAAASGLCAWGSWNQMQFGWGIHSPVTGYPLGLIMLPIMVCMLALIGLALAQIVNVWRRKQPMPVASANVTAD